MRSVQSGPHLAENDIVRLREYVVCAPNPSQPSILKIHCERTLQKNNACNQLQRSLVTKWREETSLHYDSVPPSM